MIIVKESTTQQNTQQKQKGKLEPKVVLSCNQIYFHSQSPKHVMIFQNNTLRLDSTHLDTYNLVGFNGCLHLWWIPLLTPELCVISVTMNKFPHTRLAHYEFQASCYSHHMSQSALSETNWLLRVLGCDPYLESLPSYIDGDHHRHPLTGAMDLRPDLWSTTLKSHLEISKELRTDTDQAY